MKNLGKEETTQVILQERLIAILRNIKEEQLLKVVDVFEETGIKVAEITLNDPEAFRLLAVLTKRYSKNMLLGAGTVTSVEAARLAIEAGAKFIVMPTMMPDVIQACKDLKVSVIPGAFSPTEIHQAYRLGADIIKVFPANSLGTSYFREMQGPMPEIPLAAVGGVTLENGRAFLEAGARALGVGSSLTPRDILAKEDWPKLAELAKQFKELVNK
ncbi:KHG/KDPG aldolase [Moorella thermoacetica]|uniref:KHG/KDPG aldolase n=1 Tax=Neomoorella thermoacetica TaxID=1525 RepID=A0AAC9HJS6_NEOTH|nr:bifunctional 4-hydroxy-2-oxoglutarate aldolase/2-dehydro-3-deoxy-phosphogluconate aldolase [Moorella thermoacetica]AOQ25119.1 KHG/KDPG aldolase [Moorella thermoacetica]TYL15350.1 KHG/KDPG aldolase [Moorella thermoacetica]